jgi:hypothetical protein
MVYGYSQYVHSLLLEALNVRLWVALRQYNVWVASIRTKMPAALQTSDEPPPHRTFANRPEREKQRGEASI